MSYQSVQLRLRRFRCDAAMAGSWLVVDGDRPSSDLTLRTNRAPPLRLTTPASHPAPPSLHHSMSVTSETSYIEHGDDLRISGVSTIFSRRSFDAGWPEIHAGIWRLEGSAPYG